MNPRKLIQLLKALGEYVPLAALWDLIKAADPLPASAAELRPWLTKIGVVAPLQAVVAPGIEKILWDAAPTLYGADARDAWMDDVEDEAAAAGLDPALIAVILQIASQLWAWWQSRRA